MDFNRIAIPEGEEEEHLKELVAKLGEVVAGYDFVALGKDDGVPVVLFVTFVSVDGVPLGSAKFDIGLLTKFIQELQAVKNEMTMAN